MTPEELQLVKTRINKALADYSDKNWNYSRIILVTKPLQDLQSPYALWPDQLNLKEKSDQEALKSLENEVKWGDRHSNELGFLELVSLRLNKALLESTSDEHWNYLRPVIRTEKREELILQNITTALWYEIQEVAGEEFENR